jgi:hypothetical protein
MVISISLLRGGQQERVRLAIQRGGARDLPGIIDGCGRLEQPSRSRGDHVVQVLHPSAVRGDERVVGARAPGQKGRAVTAAETFTRSGSVDSTNSAPEQRPGKTPRLGRPAPKFLLALFPEFWFDQPTARPGNTRQSNTAIL